MLHARINAGRAPGPGVGVNSFRLHLQSVQQYDRIDAVTSFVGADVSGSFGIMAGHAPMMTVLDFGLCRFRCADEHWQYAALLGGVLHFRSNELYVATRRYVRGDDYRVVADTVQEILAKEETALRELKGSIARLEQEMTRRLWRLRHGDEARYG